MKSGAPSRDESADAPRGDYYSLGLPSKVSAIADVRQARLSVIEDVRHCTADSVSPHAVYAYFRGDGRFVWAVDSG
jgi:hypothetical protein